MSLFITIPFLCSVLFPPSMAQAQTLLNLPTPGTMVTPTASFIPAVMKGIKIFPDNPLRFDFIIDTGHTKFQDAKFEAEASKLIKYFLASLTIPEDELWVNLSPYEKDRIIPDKFGATGMGRDLLGQDYVLKQLTASLIYPEDDLGKEFWGRVYAKANALYGTTDIPVNTFNKVWVAPQSATVYENGDVAFIVDSRLKVMLESDYLSLKENKGNEKFGAARMAAEDVSQISDVSSQIIREVILPEIEKEVNGGEHFTALRQIYHSMVMATWFKRNLKKSLLGRIYVDKNKISGVDIDDKEMKEKIYQQYLKAFKRGVYSYIKEEYDADTRQMIPRKYFSGGFNFGDKAMMSAVKVEQRDLAVLGAAAESTTDGALRTASTFFKTVRAAVTPFDTAPSEDNDQAALSDELRDNSLMAESYRVLASLLAEIEPTEKTEIGDIYWKNIAAYETEMGRQRVTVFRSMNSFYIQLDDKTVTILSMGAGEDALSGFPGLMQEIRNGLDQKDRTAAEQGALGANPDEEAEALSEINFYALDLVSDKKLREFVEKYGLSKKIINTEVLKAISALDKYDARDARNGLAYLAVTVKRKGINNRILNPEGLRIISSYKGEMPSYDTAYKMMAEIGHYMNGDKILEKFLLGDKDKNLLSFLKAHYTSQGDIYPIQDYIREINLLLQKARKSEFVKKGLVRLFDDIKSDAFLENFRKTKGLDLARKGDPQGFDVQTSQWLSKFKSASSAERFFLQRTLIEKGDETLVMGVREDMLKSKEVQDIGKQINPGKKGFELASKWIRGISAYGLNRFYSRENLEKLIAKEDNIDVSDQVKDEIERLAEEVSAMDFVLDEILEIRKKMNKSLIPSFIPGFDELKETIRTQDEDSINYLTRVIDQFDYKKDEDFIPFIEAAVEILGGVDQPEVVRALDDLRKKTFQAIKDQRDLEFQENKNGIRSYSFANDGIQRSSEEKKYVRNNEGLLSAAVMALSRIGNPWTIRPILQSLDFLRKDIRDDSLKNLLKNQGHVDLINAAKEVLTKKNSKKLAYIYNNHGKEEAYFLPNIISGVAGVVKYRFVREEKVVDPAYVQLQDIILMFQERQKKEAKYSRLDIAKFKDKRLKMVMQKLKDYDLNDVVLVGGGVRDGFADEILSDFDFSFKVELTPEQRRLLLDRREQVPREIVEHVMERLGVFAKKFGVSVDDLLASDGSVLWNGMELQYGGPIVMTDEHGQDIFLKRVFVDAGNKEIYQAYSGPSLLKMAMDVDGYLYGETHALEDFENGVLRIIGGESDYDLEGVLRLLRLKHQFDCRILDPDEEMIKRTIQRYQTGEAGLHPKAVIKANNLLKTLVGKARDKAAAKREVQELGVDELLENPPQPQAKSDNAMMNEKLTGTQIEIEEIQSDRRTKIAGIVKRIFKYGLVSEQKAGELGIDLFQGVDKNNMNTKGVTVVADEIPSFKTFLSKNKFVHYPANISGYKDFINGRAYVLLKGNRTNSPLEVLGERNDSNINNEVREVGRNVVEERLKSGIMILMSTPTKINELKKENFSQEDINIFGFSKLNANLIEAIFVPSNVFSLVKKNVPDIFKNKVINVKGSVLAEQYKQPVNLAHLSVLRIPDWQNALIKYLKIAKKDRTFMMHAVRFPTIEDIKKAKDNAMLNDSGVGVNTVRKNILLNDEGWVDGYMPLSSFVRIFNRMYYASNGNRVTATIETNTSVSHDSKTADANAIEFLEYLKGLDEQEILPEEIVIQSWGVGGGRFDADFLKKFIEIDQENGNNYKERIKYVLVDNSESVLKRAFEAVERYKNNIKIETIRQDLSTEMDIYKGKTHYIRFNELYDDLPAENIKKDKGGKFYRRTIRPNFHISERVELASGIVLTKQEFIRKYFEEEVSGNDLIPSNIIEKIFVGSWGWEEIDLSTYAYGNIIKSWFEENKLENATVNTGALENYVNAIELLDDQAKGYMQFYDYGVNKAGSARFKFAYDWGQPTFTVDFQFLNFAIQKIIKGIDTVVENQKQYLTRILKQKVLLRRYVVTTDRDDEAGIVSEELIPDLAEEKEGFLKRIFSSKKTPMPTLSKTQIAEELKSLWVKAKKRGSLWVTEDEIRALPSVMDLPETFKQELISNLFHPNPGKRKLTWGLSGLVDNLYHMKAQLSSSISQDHTKNKGGIDLNEEFLNLQTQGRGLDFERPFNSQNIETIPIDGLSPVIFQIIPTNLPLLLGISEKDEEPGQLTSLR